MKRIFVMAGLLAMACPRAEVPAVNVTPPFPNAPVIVISVDTLRSDRLPVYGYRGVETPAIDALAKDSLVFDHAYAHSPMTLPSHISMLTGLLPTEHEVRNNLGFHFDGKRHRTVMRALKEKGYATGAAVTSYVLRGDTGLRDEFDFYDEGAGAGPAFAEHQRSGGEAVAAARLWIGRQNRKPFFFFLHLYEPHVPYEPPEPFRSRYRDRYDGEIAAADAIVGEFLAFLKAENLYDGSIVVFTSDHGEGLGDHGEQQHSILLYREAIQVPLLVKLPGRSRAGERVTAPAASVDIARTIGVLTGAALDAPAAASLLALPAGRRVYSETAYPYLQLGWSDLRSLVGAEHHYIDSPRPELYAIRRDPAEKQNIIGEQRRIAAGMREELSRFPPVTAAATPVDEETAARLAALGYVGGVRSRPDPRTLPNPADSIGALEAMQKAFALADRGSHADAARALRAILSEHPRMADVWLRLGQVEASRGEVEQALSAYRRAMEVTGIFSPEIALMIAEVLLQGGRLDEAAAAAREAVPGSPEAAKMTLARIAIARRDFGEAARLARELTARSDVSPPAFILLGEALAASGDVPGASKALDAAVTRAGSQPVQGLDALRGDVLARSDRVMEAVTAFDREIAAFPKNRIAYSRLALVHFTLGDRAKGEAVLRRMVAADPSPASRELAAKTRAIVGE